ncbi:15-hydroxyprostaglandin dehydrogenase [NAD(+)]-like isoform X4 [Stegostoma tigrinum]|uniref:15-hydroxyprostaglandin dehydrogenase [NAD(+)]-like isoform X4 n=1 Tax=Stegostoma tigrinum TaxID=3053191 RepID=UPI00202B209A|nr:15-hydroxyprostaglandin dehydrogenase [NAD(+)]-like isoform X4 [Stegostoma tigrinum]
MILKNCVGLITGASQGLGKAFAESLLKKGAQVALIQASYLALDHMRCDRGGKGGSIINVASMSGQWYFLTLLKRHTSCNLDHQSNSIFSLLFVKSYCAQFDHHNHLESYCGQTSELCPQVQDFPISGNIFSTSTLSGFIPAAHAPVYTASKHGVLGFTRSLAEASSFGNYGVRINALCPSFVNTEILETINCEENLGIFYQFKDNAKNLMQVFGVLEPSEIAKGFVQLLEDDSLNGAVMKITTSKGIHFENY